MTLSLFISIGSFLISLLTYLYVKGTVEVFTIWQRHVVKSITIDADKNEETTLTANKGTEIAVYRVEIANTSNQNIGLSGFRVVNLYDEQMQIVTLDNLYGTYGHEGSSIRFIDENGTGMLAHLPQNLSNTLNAKQTTVYDIVIFEPIEEVQPGTKFLVFSTIKTNMIPFKTKVVRKDQKYDLVSQTGLKKSIILTIKVFLYRTLKKFHIIWHIIFFCLLSLNISMN
ncbi:hypothetical protein AB0Y21_00245 [Weissella paramesenteroides]|uniref:hypothetical protein n=1 Tax=Weissella paramesenteroides TaxID=1249 RepID=UPI003F1FB3EC